MAETLLIARWFLIVGGLLAGISLILWLTLPISLTFPPYLATALLALAYGGACRWRRRISGSGKT